MTENITSACKAETKKIRNIGSKKYIEGNKKHHKYKTFQKKVEEFFKQYDIIEYDENYFWS